MRISMMCAYVRTMRVKKKLVDVALLCDVFVLDKIEK